MFSSTFEIFMQNCNKKIDLFQSDILLHFSNTCYIFEEMEPMFVIHNISIATTGDIKHINDDINIYPVYLA